MIRFFINFDYVNVYNNIHTMRFFDYEILRSIDIMALTISGSTESSPNDIIPIIEGDVYYPGIFLVSRVNNLYYQCKHYLSV